MKLIGDYGFMYIYSALYVNIFKWLIHFKETNSGIGQYAVIVFGISHRDKGIFTFISELILKILYS